MQGSTIIITLTHTMTKGVNSYLYSLQDNYAMRRLKEMLLSQVAMETLFNAVREYLEKELNDIDIKERTKQPPRNLPDRYRAKHRKMI